MPYRTPTEPMEGLSPEPMEVELRVWVEDPRTARELLDGLERFVNWRLGKHRRDESWGVLEQVARPMRWDSGPEVLP